MDLFDSATDQDNAFLPLAERMRPDSLDQLVGQDHVAGKNGILTRSIQKDRVFSIILWGPPGCGKTTLAGIIARETSSCFVQISAVLSSVKDIREIIKTAKEQRRLHGKRTILFVDEIHRFNKAQQDAFLFHVEKGIIVLVGATTENPSFEVIPALVSRCRVITLNPLSRQDVRKILERAVADRENGLGEDGIFFSPESLDHMASMADGDVRAALAGLETTAFYAGDKPSPVVVDVEDVEKAIQKKALMYDKSGESHFNLISAFHKSLRGSDPDAALYWLVRMMAAGEDPFYIIRRMVRFATEDVGVADPGALTTALNALEAFRFLGHPEGDDALAQAAVYLATAPKSNTIYAARKRVQQRIQETGSLAVPKHIRNAPTKLMEEMGYHKGYKYAHDYKGGYTPQQYLPDALEAEQFYFPTSRGYEATIQQRLRKRS
ncbi:MAG TPA: replication-associated recombination protein A [Desulfobacteraceae bacterium]|nr:replication-associated recombination protein A [Desulfobacteraceae bacterium]